MSWRDWLRRFRREPDPKLLKRADRVADTLGHVKVVVIAKNQRALDELRRLEGYARR